MDRLARIFKGKCKDKAPEVIEVKRKSPGLLSRVHLVKDQEITSIYAYHLHPLMPALYRLGSQGLYTKLLHATELVEIGSTAPWDSSSAEGEMVWDAPRHVTVDLYDTRIAIRIINSSHRIWADWSMQVSEIDGDEVEDYPAPGKAEEAAASIPNPEDYDPPPPYSATASGSGPSGIPEYSPNTGISSSSSKVENMPRFAPPAFPPTSISSGYPHVEDGSLPSLSDEKDLDFSNREVDFAWEQVSSRARLKLMHPRSKAIYAEYVQETNAKKIVDGIQGQLLFRRTFGHEWQMAVLLTLGMLVYLGKEKVWEEPDG